MIKIGLVSELDYQRGLQQLIVIKRADQISMNQQYTKKQTRHFEGYHRSNYCTDIRTFETKNIVYKLVPTSLAKVCSYRNKVQAILGQNLIFVNNKLHPLFEFAIKIFALYRGLTFGFREKKLSDKMVEEITFDLNYELLFKQTKQAIGSVVRAVCRASVKGQFDGKTRIQKLTVFERMLDEETSEYINKTKEFISRLPLKSDEMLEQEKTTNNVLFDKKARNLLLDQQVIAEQIKAIRSIEPLTFSQQYEKFKIFEKKHSEIFKAELQIDKFRQYYFHVAKMSPESEPVLQRLGQFVDIRYESADYSSEVAHFIKEIYNQLKDYNEKVVNDFKRQDPYAYLNPNNVIIDQYALKPLLHFEPLLLEALGLGRRPRSIQGRIVFAPTPKGFDYFRAQEEYEAQFEIMIRDPMYGITQLYTSEDQEPNKEQIQQEKKDLEASKGAIVTWRFLFLSYFICNNQEFGRLPNASSQQEAFDYFRKKVAAKKQALKRDASELSQFIGTTTREAEGATFDGNFEDLGDFLSGEKDDSIILEHGNQRTIRYSSLRWALVRQASSLLQIKDSNLFHNLINVKRYALLMLFVAGQILEESERLIGLELERTGERKHMREMIEAKVKKVKKDKPQEYVGTVFTKIREYLSRNGNDKGKDYLSASNKYIYGLLEKAHNGLSKLSALSESLEQLEVKGDPKERSHYKAKLKQTEAHIREIYPFMSTLLREIFQQQVEKPGDLLHKLSSKSKDNRKLYELYRKQLVLAAHTLFQLNDEKYPLFECQVVPLLHLGELSCREQLKVSEEELSRLARDLETVEQIIEYRSRKPTNFKYIRPSKTPTY